MKSEDYYLDVLFYHRGSRRLVAIELKLEEFKPADKGQMKLSLRWLDRHQRRDGERCEFATITSRRCPPRFISLRANF